MLLYPFTDKTINEKDTSVELNFSSEPVMISGSTGQETGNEI